MATLGNGSVNGFGRMVMLVKDVGFPIAVAGYLLYRFDGLMTQLTLQVAHLSGTIDKLLQVYQRITIP